MKTILAILALLGASMTAQAAPQACRGFYPDGGPMICHSPEIEAAAIMALQVKHPRARPGRVVDAVHSLEVNEGPYTDAALLARDAELHLPE